jgi:hypothetical protein
MIKLITTASDIAKTEMLQNSLKKYGWDYEILVHRWEGFGDKILKTYQYLKNNPDIEYFFFTDAYDSMVVDTMENTLNKIEDKECILLSAELGCWPDINKENSYPKQDSKWRFVNSGGYFANVEIFKTLVENNKVFIETDDQRYFTDLFLSNPSQVKLDYNCQVFQSIAFCPDDNFQIIDDYICNTVTKTKPTLIHGNGRTPMNRYYELI